MTLLSCLFNMKKKLSIILCACIWYQVSAQNLIPNPSFDSLTKCPDSNTRSRGELTIPPWFGAGWLSTPDNFNECSTTIDLGVPYNGEGGFTYRLARSGTGYAGIFVRNFVVDESHEYIETPLTKSLEKGQTYFVRFYVAHRRDSRYRGQMVYIDAIGLNFTDTLFYTEEFIPKVTPSIEHRGTVIKDSINWTPICGVYQAKGGEKYATIGNFRKDAETIIEKEGIPPSKSPTYFFLDDALVMPFNPLPDDTLVLCDNKSFTFNASFLDATYLWSTSSTNASITVDKAGTYYVQAKINDCILTDKVVVIDTKIKGSPLKDTAICKGEKVTLNPQTTGKYQWSNGSKTPQITVNTEGSYSVTVSNVCGDFTYNSTVKFKKCACNIFVPTAFSPNNDGINDEFQAFINCDIPMKVKRFQVFNRWGNLIFNQFNTNDIRWNGQVNGVQMQEGTFVWYMEYEIEKDGKTETKIEYGDFTIVL